MNKPGLAEFDAYAAEYDGGFQDPLKKFSGGNSEIFIEQKAAWLIRHRNMEGRLLDFGCGTGVFLKTLHRLSGGTQLDGADISEGMITQARRQAGEAAQFHHLVSNTLPFADSTFDIVTASCVFHHVAPPERPSVALELLRVLKPGGLIAVFEHNTWNPLTRLIVSRCPIDAHAILLRSAECTRLLGQSKLVQPKTAFFLFFPPRWKRLWPIEDRLSWCPAGAQYVVFGIKLRES